MVSNVIVIFFMLRTGMINSLFRRQFIVIERRDTYLSCLFVERSPKLIPLKECRFRWEKLCIPLRRPEQVLSRPHIALQKAATWSPADDEFLRNSHQCSTVILSARR